MPSKTGTPKHEYQRIDSAANYDAEETKSLELNCLKFTSTFNLVGLLTLSFFLGAITSLTASYIYQFTKEKATPPKIWSDSLANYLDTSWERFRGGLYEKTPYRGRPSSAIDEAWARYTESPWFDGGAAVLSVTEEEIARSFKLDPTEQFNSTVLLDSENGGGYMATLEVFHQLHCLDMVRRYTYPDEYPRDSFKTSEAYMRYHIDHCIDMIRQVLMCTSDVTLVTFHWQEGVPVPVPDFNTWHQCRDPEAILHWAKDHEAPITHPIIKHGHVIENPKNEHNHAS